MIEPPSDEKRLKQINDAPTYVVDGKQRIIVDKDTKVQYWPVPPPPGKEQCVEMGQHKTTRTCFVCQGMAGCGRCDREMRHGWVCGSCITTGSLSEWFKSRRPQQEPETPSAPKRELGAEHPMRKCKRHRLPLRYVGEDGPDSLWTCRDPACKRTVRIPVEAPE